MGLAGGFALAGKTPVVMMQNDGFGNVVNPLTSLQQLYRLPALLIVTWRAEPGTKLDAPQHWIMGAKLLGLLKLLEVPATILEDDEAATAEALETARRTMDAQQKPYALVVRRGLFEAGQAPAPPSGDQPLRQDYIQGPSAHGWIKATSCWAPPATRGGNCGRSCDRAARSTPRDPWAVSVRWGWRWHWSSPTARWWCWTATAPC